MALDPFSDLLLQKDTRIIASVPIEDIDFDVQDGDLAIVSDGDNIKESLIRRLRTPLGAYQLMVFSYNEDGILTNLFYDSSYGSTLHTFISEPLTRNWIKTFTDTVTSVVSEDTRVSILDVNLDIVDLSKGMVRLSISYEINSTNLQEVITINSNQSGQIEVG